MGLRAVTILRRPLLRGWWWAPLLFATLLLSGCSAIQETFAAPLPPSETLNLKASLLPGGGIAGTRTVFISWAVPRESDNVEAIVIEQAKDESGPWEEIAAVRPDGGAHREVSIFRPGKFYYFRAFLARGSEDTEPGPVFTLWIPFERLPTPTPRPTSTPRPPATATPIPEATPTPDDLAAME